MRGLLDKVIVIIQTRNLNKISVLRPCFTTYMYIYIYTVKPAHAVTSIKQSPVLKVTFFLSCNRTIHMN